MLTTGSIISAIRGKPEPFNLDNSIMIVSGYMVKKSRGRHIISKMLSNSRRRWFELRCDDGSGHPSYCLLYYKVKGDKKAKGFVKLSPFDTILQAENDLSEITLRLERDKETSHQMLVMAADDEECAETWIEAFQHAILTMNRLTMIEEDEDEDRLTQTGGLKSMKSMIIAAEGTSKAEEVNWGKNVNSRAPAKSTEVEGEGAAKKGGERKRSIVKNFFRSDESGGKEKKDKGGLEITGLEWPKITGNIGSASSGKALMHCMLNEWKGDESEGSGEDESSAGGATEQQAPATDGPRRVSFVIEKMASFKVEDGEIVQGEEEVVREVVMTDEEEQEVRKSRAVTAASLGMRPAPPPPQPS